MLGETIQALRRQKNLTQEQLAERVGVSRQAVSKWELNNALPDTDKLVPLARALGVSAEELLGNADRLENDRAVPQEPSARQSVRWYWLGIVPILGGLGYLIVRTVSVLRLYQGIKTVTPLFQMGFSIPPLVEELYGPYLNEDGEIDLWQLFSPMVQAGLIFLLALAAGLLIFFLGRRKYGGK